ncbi:MAG: YncE family protein [Chloroflexi bacterium]|nr:YncE family protein [Chloroflexota bacterium]
MTDVNNPTGSSGLIAIDKRGSRARFLDPDSYAELCSFDLPARPHEVAIGADHQMAYVSIYGSGVYGNNPEPDQRIVVINLVQRQVTDTLSVEPNLAPHGLAIGADGLLYASCDASGVVAVVDPSSGALLGSIDVGSRGNHMIAMLPDGSKLYSENEDQAAFVSVLSPGERRKVGEVPIPSGALGLCCTSDGQRVLVADGGEPVIRVIDTRVDQVVDTVRLEGYQHPAQRVRCSPDGQYVVVTADQEPLATVLSGDLRRQTTFEVAPGPMGVAFHPDGATALVANHGSGRITVVDLGGARPVREFPMGVGVETLSFF